MTSPIARRSYRSGKRKAHAEETRARILASARTLFAKLGVEGASIAAIAAEAATSVQTIYAVFVSKRGILEALLNDTRFGGDYAELVRGTREAPNPVTRLEYAARIACRIYQAESAELSFLRGAAAISPELRNIDEAREMERRNAQLPLIESLSEGGHLRAELKLSEASDILWALTSRDVFRMLVTLQGWSGARYVEWLAGLLAESLLAPVEAGPQSPRS